MEIAGDSDSIGSHVPKLNRRSCLLQFLSHPTWRVLDYVSMLAYKVIGKRTKLLQSHHLPTRFHSEARELCECMVFFGASIVARESATISRFLSKITCICTATHMENLTSRGSLKCRQKGGVIGQTFAVRDDSSGCIESPTRLVKSDLLALEVRRDFLGLLCLLCGFPRGMQ